MKAASDYGALTASIADFQWTQNFKEPPSVWGVCISCLCICCFKLLYIEASSLTNIIYSHFATSSIFIMCSLHHETPLNFLKVSVATFWSVVRSQLKCLL